MVKYKVYQTLEENIDKSMTNKFDQNDYTDIDNNDVEEDDKE